MRRPTDFSKLTPAVVLFGAALFFTVALVGAFTVDPTRPPEALRDESGSRPTPGDVPLPEPTLRWKALESAADQDPFQANRRRTPAYRLPGERGEIEVSAPMPAAPSATLLSGDRYRRDADGWLGPRPDRRGIHLHPDAGPGAGRIPAAARGSRRGDLRPRGRSASFHAPRRRAAGREGKGGPRFGQQRAPRVGEPESRGPGAAYHGDDGPNGGVRCSSELYR